MLDLVTDYHAGLSISFFVIHLPYEIPIRNIDRKVPEVALINETIML